MKMKAKEIEEEKALVEEELGKLIIMTLALEDELNNLLLMN